MRTACALAIALSAAVAAPAGAFEIRSTAFADGGAVRTAQVLDGSGCAGGNMSPDVSWSGAPAGTRSYAVTLYDPDAPTGSGWWHWVVFDIPAGAAGMPAGAGDGGSLPPGAVQSRTDFGKPGYGGPCPPPGPAHRYVLTVTALKVATLGLDPEASAAMVGFTVRANALASASITVTYGR